MEDQRIQINRDTLEETVSNVTPELPYMANLCRMNELPDETFPWHWHGEVEFFYMRSGAIEYRVPGGAQVFCEGEAGFVNANVLHMTRAVGEAPSVQEEHLFLPSFIFGQPGSAIEARYVRPVLRSGGIELFRFDAAHPARDEVVRLMREAYDLRARAEEGYELAVRERMSRVWLKLFQATRALQGTAADAADGARIKGMLSFIAAHYGERIGAADIARAGMIGERECFRVFRRRLHMTPLECLTAQRLSRACELLRDTDLTVLEISLTCGFCGASYFGKVFREHFGMSPKAYRAGR